MYYSLIYPFFNYCSEDYGETDNYKIDALFMDIKIIIRLICRASYTSSTKLLFPMLNILQLHSIYKLRLGLFMYNVYCGLLVCILIFFMM